jgi:hypothetical protein
MKRTSHSSCWVKFCWAQTKGHTQKNGHDRNGGVHDFFYSPIQFGSGRDIVAGGDRERQWPVGVATDGRGSVTERRCIGARAAPVTDGTYGTHGTNGIGRAA